MAGKLLLRNTLRTTLPIAFLAAAAIGGCHGTGEMGGGEHGGEHVGEHGEEESGTTLTPDQTYDEVRKGARLILSYDAGTNAFVGTVENTTGAALPRVRVEVHLSNGTELGPTTPKDLAPGEKIPVQLPATAEPFAGWSAHAEVGGEHGASHEAGGEHGAGDEAGGRHGTPGERGGEHDGE